jgi:hypothetical protein
MRVAATAYDVPRGPWISSGEERGAALVFARSSPGSTPYLPSSAGRSLFQLTHGPHNLAPAPGGALLGGYCALVLAIAAGYSFAATPDPSREANNSLARRVFGDGSMARRRIGS